MTVAWEVVGSRVLVLSADFGFPITNIRTPWRTHSPDKGTQQPYGKSVLTRSKASRQSWSLFQLKWLRAAKRCSSSSEVVITLVNQGVSVVRSDVPSVINPSGCNEPTN